MRILSEPADQATGMRCDPQALHHNRFGAQTNAIGSKYGSFRSCSLRSRAARATASLPRSVQRGEFATFSLGL